jgi:hypothetical protein
MSASAGGGRLDGSDRVGPSETRTCQHFTRTDFLTGSLNAPDRFWRCDACGVEGIYPPELDDPKDAIYLSYLAADHAAQVAASSETVEYALRTVAVLGYERALSRVGPAPSGLRAEVEKLRLNPPHRHGTLRVSAAFDLGYERALADVLSTLPEEEKA